jgi:hypothetical protein
MKGFITGIFDFFTEGFTLLKDSVSQVFSDLINGIVTMAISLLNFVIDKVNTIIPARWKIAPISIDSTTVIPKENGGRFMQGGLLVGEKGPELIFPDYSGRVANARDTERIVSSKEKIIENTRIESNKMYDSVNPRQNASSNINMPIINNTSNNFSNGGNKGSDSSGIRTIISSTIFDKLYNY